MELPGKTSHRSDILLLQSERAYIVEWAMTEAWRERSVHDGVLRPVAEPPQEKINT